MRVLVTVSAADGAARRVDVRLDTPSGRQLATNTMETTATPPGIRPSADNLPPAEAPYAALARDRGAAGLAALVKRLEEGSAQRGDVEAIGRYLFCCLLGERAWKQIVAAAKNGDGSLELALRWPAHEHALNRLPWEAMHDGTAFLGVNPDLAIAVTRVVEDAGSTVAPRRVPAPARVLFAIGADLEDEAIRPGAELIGLLRDAERGDGAIDALVLDEASLGRLAAECKRFRPHVVHFVGHGRLAENGGEVQLRKDDGEGHTWADGERLLEALRAGGRPELVVLTGCETAAVGEHMDSLAAELVQGGVPVAIGMAGEISDPVCRLFSRNFARALNTGESLVTAMAHGRRAGLRQQWARPADHPAWAYPSIYLAPGVPGDFALVDRGAASVVLRRVENYGLVQDPVFCGRRTFARLFDRLLDHDDPLEVLFAYAEESGRLGKTRLLHEFAGKALRAGHVVVMIDDLGGDPNKLPRSAAEFAVEMVKRIVKARQHFGLEVGVEGAIVGLLARENELSIELAGVPAEQRASLILSFLGKCKAAIDGDALREAIAADLVRLIEEARACEDATVDEHSRVVVVLGGLGHWDEATRLVCESMLNPCGLGSPEEHVPVFLTCSLADPRGNELRAARLSGGGQAWVRYEELQRFRDGEETLAYQWILLHPRDKFKPLSDSVYTPVTGSEFSWEPFRKAIQGVPGNCDHLVFYGVANALMSSGWLDSDGDVTVLERYMEQQA